MRRIQTDLLDSLLREVATRLGFHHDAGDRERLRFLLRDRLAVIGNNDVATYRARLGDPVSGPGELALLADALTIGETYFLRGIDQLEALLTQPSLLLITHDSQPLIRLLRSLAPPHDWGRHHGQEPNPVPGGLELAELLAYVWQRNAVS